jgi:hypothetical protein
MLFIHTTIATAGSEREPREERLDQEDVWTFCFFGGGADCCGELCAGTGASEVTVTAVGGFIGES